MNGMKRIIKKVIYFLFSSSCEDIKKKISSCSVVSFDVFDTLIKRDVLKPEDVFLLVEKEYDQQYNTSSNFYIKRIEAEKKARYELKREVNIHDIYRYYAGDNGSVLKKMEITLEHCVCTPSHTMVSVLEEAIKQKKKVLLISDMYLSTEIISSILNKCGIYRYDRLYVSCEAGRSKSKGELYDYIREQENINKKWVHIGDSIKGDYLKPLTKGIRAYLVARHGCRPIYYRGNDDVLSNFMQNHENVQLYNDYERIGYEILGPILYGFSRWLYSQISEKKYDCIIFLARDSALIKKAYNIMYVENTRQVYLHISRKAALNCIVDLLNGYDELHDLFVAKDSDTMKDLFRTLSIQQDVAIDINRSIRLEMESYINKNDRFDKSKLVEQIKHEKEKQSKEQRTLINEYLKQLGISGKCAIVDVGWEGRTQWALERIHNDEDIDRNFVGYYFGIIRKYPRLTSNLEMNSYLGDLKCTDRDGRVIMESVALFETLFSNKEGSTIEYYRAGDGSVCAKQSSIIPQNSTQEVIEEIQNAALAFVSDMTNSPVKEKISWNSKHIFDIYKEFAIHPSNRVVKLLKHIEFEDRSNSIFGSNHSIAYYMLHITKFKRDMLTANYRVLFLKDLIKIPLPYFEVLYWYYILKKNRSRG